MTESKQILSIINGGEKAVGDNPPEWLSEFKKEMKQIHKKKREAQPGDQAKTYNHEASYMNTLLCDFENKILQVIYKALNSPKECVLCFDGLMVLKSHFDLVSVTDLETVVEVKLNVEIKLAVKEMSEGFGIDEL